MIMRGTVIVTIQTYERKYPDGWKLLKQTSTTIPDSYYEEYRDMADTLYHNDRMVSVSVDFHPYATGE
jgi:hypothetical protein